MNASTMSESYSYCKAKSFANKMLSKNKSNGMNRDIRQIKVQSLKQISNSLADLASFLEIKSETMT